MRFMSPLLILLFAASSAIAAGTASRTSDAVAGKPGGYQWLVLEQDSWTAANAQLGLAGGDPYTVALPTQDPSFPWLILKRVSGGVVYIAPEAPFVLETFDTMDPAITRYSLIGADHAPMIISTMDGKFHVISLRQPSGKARAVRH